MRFYAPASELDEFKNHYTSSEVTTLAQLSDSNVSATIYKIFLASVQNIVYCSFKFELY